MTAPPTPRSAPPHRFQRLSWSKRGTPRTRTTQNLRCRRQSQSRHCHHPSRRSHGHGHAPAHDRLSYWRGGRLGLALQFGHVLSPALAVAHAAGMPQALDHSPSTPRLPSCSRRQQERPRLTLLQELRSYPSLPAPPPRLALAPPSALSPPPPPAPPPQPLSPPSYPPQSSSPSQARPLPRCLPHLLPPPVLPLPPHGSGGAPEEREEGASQKNAPSLAQPTWTAANPADAHLVHLPQPPPLSSGALSPERPPGPLPAAW
mmetsp:Transcript_8567/g.17107  ORF Transcript_8567/g.17107 Transcript_8567/m.17107 type:complete len:260 (+) Transcript_8567:302-1081(+)